MPLAAGRPGDSKGTSSCADTISDRQPVRWSSGRTSLAQRRRIAISCKHCSYAIERLQGWVMWSAAWLGCRRLERDATQTTSCCTRMLPSGESQHWPQFCMVFRACRYPPGLQSLLCFIGSAGHALRSCQWLKCLQHARCQPREPFVGPDCTHVMAAAGQLCLLGGWPRTCTRRQCLLQALREVPQWPKASARMPMLTCYAAVPTC